MTPITKYMNNEIKQDMIKEKKCFTDESDEKTFNDMRHSKRYTGELEELSITMQISSNNFTYKGSSLWAFSAVEAQSFSLFASWILVRNHK